MAAARFGRALCFAAVVTLCLPVAALAAEYDRESLRGLPGIGVMLEDIGNEARAFGLDTTDVRTHVELALRQNGIRVLSTAELLAQRRMPFLYVNIAVTRYTANPNVITFDVAVQLEQMVTIPTNSVSGLQPASTWQAHSHYGLTGPMHAREDVYSGLDTALEEFANDWLAVHPKN
jgi:hypothetical protein